MLDKPVPPEDTDKIPLELLKAGVEIPVLEKPELLEV